MSEVTANGKAENGFRRHKHSKGANGKEKVLLEQTFTIHFQSSIPTVCQVTLTESHLILEECDEGVYDNESSQDLDIIRERYPVKDLFGFHVVRKEKEADDDDDEPQPSSTTVHICVIFYTFAAEKDKTRSRVARIFEIDQAQHSYQESLRVAKEWALQIGRVLKRKCPNSNKDPEELSVGEDSPDLLEDKIERSFKELIASEKDKDKAAQHQSSKDVDADENEEEEDGEEIKQGIDLEFDTATFSLVKSILFSRRFLVIVNPVSGQGKGANLLEEYIMPVFADSGIQVDLLTTEHAGHAHSYLTTSDLSNVDGIVSVGGDGLLNEIVNGLRSRDHSGAFAKIPVGVVATGSGNGVARSMADYCSSAAEYLANPTLHSTLAAARGCVVPINLAEVTLDKKVLHSFLSVGWGLMSDIDIESEVLRSIGEIRFFIWSFLKLAKLKRYKAELSYVPYDASGSVCSRVRVDDEFVCIYSACQSYIGSYMFFAPDAKPNDGMMHLTYLPSSTGRLAAAKFLLKLDGGTGTHLGVSPTRYVKVKEFTIRCEEGIGGCLTMDGEHVKGEEITVKICDPPLYMLAMG